MSFHGIINIYCSSVQGIIFSQETSVCFMGKESSCSLQAPLEPNAGHSTPKCGRPSRCRKLLVGRVSLIGAVSHCVSLALLVYLYCACSNPFTVAIPTTVAAVTFSVAVYVALSDLYFAWSLLPSVQQPAMAALMLSLVLHCVFMFSHTASDRLFTIAAVACPWLLIIGMVLISSVSKSDPVAACTCE